MRSTLKCDIIVSLNIGIFLMKTKIIYISGNEVFDMADIRAAFEEVRATLNLDKNTVLFGVPVDQDDAGLSKPIDESITDKNIIEPDPIVIEEAPNIPESKEDIIPEPVVEPRRGRSRKTKVIEEKIPDETPEPEVDEKIVPILSILSAKDDDIIPETPDDKEDIEPEIVSAVISQETTTSTDIAPDIPVSADEIIDDDAEEPDPETNLEKLLSEMKPLDEDVLETPVPTDSNIEDSNDDDNIDATLEKLATEFVQTQDKITTATKSGTRNKIGKLRNILPFKQSKHADQGLGDLFGWAGVAANDEEFSVPGFFTSASSKK